MIGWGILGTGGISARFVEGLAHAPGARVAAVASRTGDRAEAFRAQIQAPRAHVEVEALAADPDVDVVYIGTPHVRHAADAIACIDAGKAVLIEKPMAIDAAEAERILERARQKNVFVMEAMWTRFFPAIENIIDAIRSAAIGEPAILEADFGFTGDRATEPRMFDPAFAGGALLDVGVYPIWLAIALLGDPTRVAASGHWGPSGVDERVGMTLAHVNGALSMLSCAITADTASRAAIFGTSGAITLDPPWWRPSGYAIGARHVDAPFLGNGYAHEAIEVMRCLRAGERESPRLGWATSIEVLRTVDRVRAACAPTRA